MRLTEGSRRLCLLTEFFPPELGAPQGRLFELAERLQALGWRVNVVTAAPNYPIGRVFAGYSRWRPQREALGCLEVLRLPMWPTQKGIVRRIVSQLTFALSAALLAPLAESRPSLVYVESPPLFLAIAARWLGWIWRCPYVINVSDLWPDSAFHLGYLKEGAVLTLGRCLERWLYRGAIGVTGQSDEIVSHVARVHPSARTLEVTNGVETQCFGRHRADEAARAALGPQPGPVFIYAGLLGYAQGLDRIVDWSLMLPSGVPGRIVLVGDGPLRESIVIRLARGDAPRVRLLPAVERARVPALLAAADVALISLGARIPGVRARSTRRWRRSCLCCLWLTVRHELVWKGPGVDSSPRRVIRMRSWPPSKD